jgi:hypothetical protein
MYVGDEGGFMCHLTFDEAEKEKVFLVSITQLSFDRRLPVAREIALYQKHRIKRIRRDNARSGYLSLKRKGLSSDTFSAGHTRGR